jgi:hypothetical protein
MTQNHVNNLMPQGSLVASLYPPLVPHHRDGHAEAVEFPARMGLYSTFLSYNLVNNTIHLNPLTILTGYIRLHQHLHASILSCCSCVATVP